MLAELLGAAIEADGAQLDAISTTVWSAWASGHISDGQAQHFAEAIQARKNAARPSTSVAGGFRRVGAIFTPPKPQRVPKRPEILQRRRRLAAAGPLPPNLAAAFTMAELAVMRVIGNEIRQRGNCDRCIDEIAARAACSRKTVQRALRAARALGIIAIKERRRRGQKSLPNVVTCVSAAWASWLCGSGDRTISAPHEYKKENNLILKQNGMVKLKQTAPIGDSSRLWQRGLSMKRGG